MAARARSFFRDQRKEPSTPIPLPCLSVNIPPTHRSCLLRSPAPSLVGLPPGLPDAPLRTQGRRNVGKSMQKQCLCRRAHARQRAHVC
eukprot:2004310-Pleurochrysis_carterae.AAC.1